MTFASLDSSIAGKREVHAWIEATERDLLSQVEQGPVVIG